MNECCNSFSVDAIKMISKEFPIIGIQVMVIFVNLKVAPYGYSLFIWRALVSTIHGNFRTTLNRTTLNRTTLNRTSLKSIEMNF